MADPNRSVANMPSGAYGYGTLIVFGVTLHVVVQIYVTGVATPITYVRTMYGDRFLAWGKLERAAV